MPPQKHYVRGENGPGCWIMTPVPNEPNKCVFQWLLDTNLKVPPRFALFKRSNAQLVLQGWIPQTIIDTALSFAMCDYVRYVRNHAAQLHQQGKF